MASSKQVIKANKIGDINIEEIIMASKKIKNKVSITLNENSPVVQTPFLEVTGTLRKTPVPHIYQLDTLFKGDSDRKMNQWYEFIENLETHITNHIMSIGTNWFTQKNVIIKSLIRENENDSNIHFIKWPICLTNNIFIDENKKPFDPSEIKDKDLIKLIIEISDLWVQENQCGLAVIVQKVLVKPHIEKIESEYIFDDSDSSVSYSDDDNKSNIISLLATEQKKSSSKKEYCPKKELVSTLSLKEKIVPKENPSRSTLKEFIEEEQLGSHEEVPEPKKYKPVSEHKNMEGILQPGERRSSRKEQHSKSIHQSNKQHNTNNSQNKFNQPDKHINGSHTNEYDISRGYNNKQKNTAPLHNKQKNTEPTQNNPRPINKNKFNLFSDLSDDISFDSNDSEYRRVGPAVGGIPMRPRNNNIRPNLMDKISVSSRSMSDINDDDLDFE